MALRTKRHTNHDVILTVAFAVTALILTACQKDDMPDSNGKVTIHPVIDRAIETSIQTRALSGSYTEFTENQQTLSAHAIAFQVVYDDINERIESTERDATQDQNGVFSPITNGWRSTVEVEPGYKYYLYAYSRTMPSASTPVFSYGNESNVSLEFNGLDIITESDPLVCVAAAGKVLPDNPAANQYPELTKGTFDITSDIDKGMVPSTYTDGTSFKAFMALDHLYSKATLSFRIDSRYSQLREVRIKDIEIKVNNNTLPGTHTYYFYSRNLNLASGTASGSAKSINLYDGPNATAQPQEGDDFIALTTSDREFGHYYFLPIDPTPSMYLEVTYDIYDLQGNPVRQNQTATNNQLFQAISNNGGKATAGNNYRIKILVSPTYLYQLSDDDLELGLTVE